MAGVHVVRAGELIGDTAQTEGLVRHEAISARTAGSRQLWVGRSELVPGGHTGPHHHGDAETAVYVVSGRGRWLVDDQPGAVEAGAGDFVLIGPRVVHSEENVSESEPVSMIVARSSADASVVNLVRAHSTPTES
jgi:uncharacterized RmlC-like cupin family protein